MRRFSKLISVILTVIMIMSVVPVGATGTAGGASSPSSDIPDGAIPLFNETFDSGYTFGQNWFDVADSTGNINEGWTGVQKLTQCYTYGNWDIQSYLRHSTTNTNDSISVVDVSNMNLGGNFSGGALRLYNDRATGYDTDYMTFRRNFNGTQGISLTSGEYAGKKLVYEADVKIVSAGAYHSSFFAPSRNQAKIYDYPGNGAWKPSFQTSGKFRVEEGTWANSSYGPVYMWYGTPESSHNYKNEAGKIKVILDQTGAVDTITVYNNGEVLTSTAKDVLSGHKRSGMKYTGLLPAGYQGQEFNFGNTIYGVWGNVSNMEIYVDNFKAYLVDELPGTFKVSQISVNSTAFDAEVDTVDFTFTNEIDNATVTADKAVLLDAQGREVNNGIVSVALKEGDNKTLSVTVTNALASEADYTVALKDGIKDVNGNLVKREHIWYEYPINEYYTVTNGTCTVGAVACAYTPASGSTGAMMSKSDGSNATFVDCYIPQMTTDKTTASFKTCRLLAYESASPANEAITDYVKGQEQEIVLQFNDLLADTVDIANAFVVKDEDEREVAGLAASFGDAKNIVKLQLKDLELGNGVHTISSKPNALFNAAGKGAIITYKFDTVDFTATASESGFDYLPKVEKDIEVTLSLPTTLTADSIATGFEVKDDQGNTVSGLGVTMVDNKTITLQLKDLQVEKGVYTINATSALTDSRGLTPALNLTFNVIEFKATTSEGSGFQLKPGEDKTITVTLSLPTTLTADNIATGFKVENSAGREISGLGVTMVDNKTITLQLKDLVVDNGKYYIKATSALTDAAGRSPEMNLMFNVAKEVILFEEDFEFGYTLNENWVNDNNKTGTSADGSGSRINYSYGEWDFQSYLRNQANNDGDSISVVDVSRMNLGGNFSGNALRLYNIRANSYDTNYMSFRRNFNGTQGISLTSGEHAGKKLVYEADVKIISSGAHQSSFFAPSRNQAKIFDYANSGAWKPTLQTSGNFRVEEGAWANSSYGPIYMWYGTPASAHNYKNDAGKIKIILDQTGEVDTITVYNNGAVLKNTANSVLSGHKRSGLTYTGLLPAGYQGQEFNFADTIYGVWGSVNGMEIYVDNFKAYLIDSFSVSDVELVGSETAFEPSTDSVVYTFTGEVDPATINESVNVLDAEGNKVVNAVKSATLEEGGKKLRVVLAKSLVSESNYKVVLNDTIKDIYGTSITQGYEWYEYPINENYTATNGKYMIGAAECTYTPASGSTGAKMAKADGTSATFVDCYIPYTPTTNREVEFTTARKLLVESITPAAVPSYDLGKDQVITIKFEEVLADNTDLSNAFIVTDKDGKNIPGLAAEFGETKDIVKLQLSGLQLGDGKHMIESVDGKLANADGLFANVSISFNTVDFMVIYSEPGTGVITEYVEGKDQTILLGLSSPATLAAEEFATGFEVVDENGTKIEGIQATYNANNAAKTDDDTITLQLSGLRLGKGMHTIKATDKLIDRRGRKLEFEYSFKILPFKATYESSITGYEPKTEKAINIELTYPLNDESANAINDAFVVENQENLRVSGLTVTVSEDKKVVTLQLKDLDITGGSYKITSKDGSLVSIKGEQLAAVMITVNTASKVVGDLAGEGAGSGSALPGDANFDTVVLLEENFENSIEKAEKGIEFTPYVNWYTSPDKKPSIFTLEKIGAEYRDAEVKIVKDPADPDGDNMVLMNNTGYYGKDGSVLASSTSNSTAPNYHIVKRALDKQETITEDQYTVIRMSSRIYVPSSSVPHVPLSSQQLRNASYILGATSRTGVEINDSNFARHTDGSPKFHMYNTAATVSTGVAGSVDALFTTDEWHTIEFVFSANEFAATGQLTPSHHVYLDGKLVSETAFASNYSTIDGMMSKIVGADSGSPVVVYYDDWKITKETKFRTHVDVPQQNVKENDDITLTLTKKLNAESVKLIEDSLKEDTLEDLVTVKDSEGNIVDANITITNGNVITIVPKNGLKYQTDYILEVKATTKVNGIPQTLKSEDGEAFGGLSYPFTTAKALNVYIDAEASKASFNCFSTAMETATRFTYTMNLSGAHDKDVIAAVAAFNEKEELIGIQYVTIPSGSTAANFDFNTFAGRTGAKIVRMYIWEAKTDGSMGRLMQLPDEITSR